MTYILQNSAETFACMYKSKDKKINSYTRIFAKFIFFMISK